MKINSYLVVTATVSLVAAGMVSIAQFSGRGLSTREFMRDKLEFSQKILEGLALEDFDLIAGNSKKLSAMSREATWQVFQNPDYDRFSQDFRRNADALTKAAGTKNLEGATLAYFKLTMNCVECHKFVRGKLVAILK
jgi:hypothetical protein